VESPQAVSFFGGFGHPKVDHCRDGWESAVTVKDLAGLDRFLVARLIDWEEARILRYRSFPMKRLGLFPIALLPFASSIHADALSLGWTFPMRAEWVRDEFNGSFALRGSYARNLGETIWMEANLGFATSVPSSVEDGPTPRWNTYSTNLKFVHQVWRLGRLGFLYGAGAGFSFVDGTLESGLPEGSGPLVTPSRQSFDHGSPVLTLDARVRAHFLEDRFFLELKPLEVSAGFGYRAVAPWIGVGWGF
jgi:hypothetical protein